MSELHEVDVGHELWIPFKWLDDTPGGSNLGRAEFAFCPKFFRGRLKEYWVYPMQQRDQESFWHWKGYTDWAPTFSCYQQLDDVRIWRVYWCREHKTVTSEMYVPNGARWLQLNGYGMSFWRSHKESDEEVLGDACLLARRP